MKQAKGNALVTKGTHSWGLKGGSVVRARDTFAEDLSWDPNIQVIHNTL